MGTLNEKQLQILQVAERLFAEKGFDGTSVRNIAKEAGINIAMVSYYFGSKEKMLEQLILHRSSDLKIQLDNLLREELPPMEKLDKLIELYLARVNKNRCIYQIVHNEMIINQRALNLDYFTEVKLRNLELLGQIIQQGQDAGVFRKDIIVPFLPTTILGIFFQFQINRPLYSKIFGLETDEAFDAFVKNELATHIKQTIKALLTYENR